TREEVEIHPSSLKVGSRLYFTVKTYFDSPSALWVTNGTAQGTRKLASFPTTWVFLPKSTLGQRILFAANDHKHGSELWTTDGTPGGTRLFKDFCPGPCSSGAAPVYLYKNRLVINAYTRDQGGELWTTDGTIAGTRILRDVCRGPCSAHPWVLGVRNDRLIFIAYGAAEAPEVWSSDGTSQGTTRIRRLGADAAIGSGSYGSAAVLPTGYLFILFDHTFGQEPWITDGTASGTRIVRDIASFVGSSDPRELMRLGNEVFFFATDAIHGYELWKSDGSDGGTRLVAELTPGDEPHSAPTDVGKVVEAGGRLFFALNHGVWRTDGTQAGTLRLTPDGFVLGRQLAAVGSRVFFTAENSVGFDREIWVSDGTSAGTRRIAEVPFSRPEFFTPFQGRLYFSTGDDLWSSDGTPEGTGRLQTPLEAFRDASFLTVHRGVLYFFAYSDDHGTELWKTDGTAEGTTLAVELVPGYQGLTPNGMISTGERLFLLGYGIVWASDGTPAGTLLIGNGVDVSNGGVTVFRNEIYALTPLGLWRSDGTLAGSRIVELGGPPIYSPFVVFGDRLYSNTNGSFVETDGTPAGTRVIQAPSPSWQISPFTSRLVPAGSHLFFSAFEEDSGTELWALPAAGSYARQRAASMIDQRWMIQPSRKYHSTPASTN
ncbi:MAG TPA: hypothetical protein VK899_06705, partial [Gemmatimonadales bacterium]|nr:hypothetical protein [Gemmatimonadales bacterium]